MAELLKLKDRYPASNMLMSLTAYDETALVDLYRSEPELTNKVALTWALAAVGREEAARCLIDTLTADYGNKKLNTGERMAMRDTLEALGFVAAISDHAFAFLRDASAESFWEQRRTWREGVPQAEAVADKRMAGLALQAMGFSLRSEVPETLIALRETDSEFVRETSGYIASAAFYCDFGRERGIQALLGHRLALHGDPGFRQWYQRTQNGSNWWAWTMSLVRKPKR
jgi:hypothetical protein